MRKTTISLLILVLILLFSLPITASDTNGELWVVKMKDDTSESQVSRLMKTENGIPIGNLGYFVVDEETAKSMACRNDVEFIEQSGVSQLSELTATVSDPFFDQQWALKDLNWEEARTIAKGKSSVKIAIIDSGFYYEHEDAGNIVAGYNFINGTRQPDSSPKYPHGTHVAGIIGAATNNGLGIAGAVENCSINIYRVFDGDTAENALIAIALIAAVDDGADIINMSFGSFVDSSALRDAVEYAASKGVIMLAAVGNYGDNPNGSQLQYPAAYDDVIGVGAYDRNHDIAGFSQHNESVHISAPGVNIYSTIHAPSSYQNQSGTSMATPYVTGLAALALSYDSTLTPDEFKTLLKNTATDLGDTGYDVYFGWGAINYYALLANMSGVDQTLASVTFSAATKANLLIPGDEDDNDTVRRTLTPVLHDGRGVTLNVPHTATWELVSATDQTGISLEGNILTVTKEAVPQTISLTVTVRDGKDNVATKTDTIELKREAAISTLTLKRTVFALPREAAGDVTYNLECTGTDQNGAPIEPTSSEITWEMEDSGELIGVHVGRNTGELTVNSGARYNKVVRIRFSIGSASFTDTITFSTLPSEWTATIRGKDYVLAGNTYQYTCAMVDQYGNTESNQSYTWSVSDNAGVTIDNSGKLTVAPSAASGIATITASEINGSASATFRVTIARSMPDNNTMVDTDWGRYLIYNGMVYTYVDAVKITSALDRRQEKIIIDLSDITAENYAFRLSGDIFTALNKQNKTIQVVTELANLTLPSNLGLDVAAADYQPPAALNLSISMAKTTLSNVVYRQGSNLTSNTISVQLKTTNGTIIPSTSGLLTMELPATGDYTSIVKVLEDGSMFSVPTKRDQESNMAIGKTKNLGSFVLADRAVTFSDVEDNNWARATIYNMAERFVIDGKTSTTFAPYSTITRAEFATMIARGLGIAPKESRTNFQDVPADEWFAPYVTAAFDAGLIQGYSNTTFAPHDYVTREQAILILVRALTYMEMPAETLDDGTTNSMLIRFSDNQDISSWARGEVAQGVANGITNGYPNGTLLPQQLVDRAEGATFIEKLLLSADLI